MKTATGSNILAYIKEKKEVTAKEIIAFAGISPQAVFRQLKKLIAKGLVTKIGLPPHVFYLATPGEAVSAPPNPLPQKEVDVINKDFFYISPIGKIYEKNLGFFDWCREKKLPYEKTATEYVTTILKYEKYKINGLIDGTPKLKNTFPNVYVDALFYLDFYAIERFGKTKLGALLLYAKQTQNKKLINEIVSLAKNKIIHLTRAEQINAVGFIPPTVPRTVQFTKEFSASLALPLPQIKIVKATGEVSVPQKSLSKLEDRAANAANTIFIDDSIVYKNILLIDDAVGSGATINETARKIREKKLCNGKIIGFALVGSFKGFDVISEV